MILTQTVTYVYDGNISSDTVSSEVNSITSEQNKSGLNIYYTNADSILNKREKLQAENNLKNPDFVVITEVYPKSVSPNIFSQAEFEIDDYERLRGEISDSCRGVCIYVYYKSELSVSECKDFIDCRFQESCWCIVTLETKEKRCLEPFTIALQVLR